MRGSSHDRAFFQNRPIGATAVAASGKSRIRTLRKIVGAIQEGERATAVAVSVQGDDLSAVERGMSDALRSAVDQQFDNAHGFF